MLRYRRAVFSIALAIVVAPRPASADTWVETRSPNFTVVSNAGEKKARNIAWQFEQIRAAIEKGWPWSRVKLSLPVVVIAVKDEASMKAMAPYYWEENRAHPGSVFATAGDRHYITVRTDVEDQDREGVNPYRAAYWSYALLSIEASFNRGLPLWFVTGLSAVLSNSIVREDAIQFGRPIPAFVRILGQESRLPLNQLFAVTRQTPYYTDSSTKARFDAQCWGLVQYLLFAESEQQVAHIDDLTKRLLTGAASDAAVVSAYGSIDRIEAGYLRYVKQGMFKYARLPVDTDVSREKYPTRVMGEAEHAAERAGFHVALGRLGDAQKLLDEARKASPELPRILEVEAAAFDREQKMDDARHAYQKAADLHSTNFYVYDRLAVFTASNRLDAASLTAAQKLLAKSVELNDSFAPAFASLAGVMVLLNQADAAIGPVQRALLLEPGVFSHRLLASQVLVRLYHFDEAKVAAQAALELARTDQQRQSAQSALDTLARRSAQPRVIVPQGGIPGGAADASVGGAQGGATRDPAFPPPPPPPPPPASPVRIGGLIKQPIKLKDVRPVYPRIAQAAHIQGAVALEATIGPDGAVQDAKVLRSIPLLDQAALDAVRQWQFAPTLLNGVGVPVIMTVTVNFTLASDITLRVTDAKGAVTIVGGATIDYAGNGTPAVSSDGIRIYQGDAQLTLKWSLIDTVTFSRRNTALVSDRLSGQVLLKSGQRMTCDFVMPAAPGGGLKGKITQGDFSIHLADVAQISPAAPLSK